MTANTCEVCAVLPYRRANYLSHLFDLDETLRNAGSAMARVGGALTIRPEARAPDVPFRAPRTEALLRACWDHLGALQSVVTTELTELTNLLCLPGAPARVRSHVERGFRRFDDMERWLGVVRNDSSLAASLLMTAVERDPFNLVVAGEVRTVFQTYVPESNEVENEEVREEERIWVRALAFAHRYDDLEP